MAKLVAIHVWCTSCLQHWWKQLGREAWMNSGPTERHLSMQHLSNYWVVCSTERLRAAGCLLLANTSLYYECAEKWWDMVVLTLDLSQAGDNRVAEMDIENRQLWTCPFHEQYHHHHQEDETAHPTYRQLQQQSNHQLDYKSTDSMRVSQVQRLFSCQRTAWRHALDFFKL